MNKRMIAACFVLTLALGLCGCQLAKPEDGSTDQADRLVGVFVTTDYLNLTDEDTYLDAYLEDHAGSISDGQTITIDTSIYQNRVYAAFVDEPYVDDDGEYHFAGTYEFEDLEGIVLACYQNRSGEEPYYSISAGEGICDVHSKVGGEDKRISGTIWMAKNSGQVCFYMNPVYQTADGAVYMVPGSGMSLDAGVGGRASQELHKEVTVTQNGETNTYTFSVEVFIDFAEPAQTVTVIQMNGNDQEIKRETFLADKLPTTFTPEEATAYLIAVSESENAVHRQINEQGDEWFEVFIQLDEQICTKNGIFVEWG